MDKYKIPDERWAIFAGADTHEAYIEKMVIPGRFHAGVPKAVRESYLTAEHLMAHAYYHWPLYDEALHKLLGIFEMAVKLRCGQFSIKLNQPLFKLIEQLCEKEPLKDLKPRLDYIRSLRNHFAHPDRNSFAGGTFRTKIFLLISTLNLLFMEEADVVAAQEKKTFYKQVFSEMEKGRFILEHGGLRYLCQGAKVWAAFEVRGEWVSLWHFQMVLPAIHESLSKHSYMPAFWLALKDVQSVDGGLAAVDFKASGAVRFYPNADERNTATFEAFERELWRVSEDDKSMFELFQNGELNRDVGEFEVRERWR